MTISQYVTQLSSQKTSSESVISLNDAKTVKSNKDIVTISSNAHQQNQQSVFDRFFEKLSTPDQKKIQSLDESMQPLLEKEENGTITKKEQEVLDSTFQKFDEIIIANGDEQTQRILLA